MPIIKFSGVSKKDVFEYSKKVNELANLIEADPNNLLLICEDSEIVETPNSKKPIYITIEWLARPSKQQAVVDHLMENFKNEKSSVFVFITNADGMLYNNGEKKGKSN